MFDLYHRDGTRVCLGKGLAVLLGLDGKPQLNERHVYAFRTDTGTMEVTFEVAGLDGDRVYVERVDHRLY